MIFFGGNTLYAQTGRCLFPQQLINDPSFQDSCSGTIRFNSYLVRCDTSNAVSGYYFIEDSAVHAYWQGGVWTGADHSVGGQSRVLFASVYPGNQWIKIWSQTVVPDSAGEYEFSFYSLFPNQNVQHIPSQFMVVLQNGLNTPDTQMIQVNPISGSWQFQFADFNLITNDSTILSIYTLQDAGMDWYLGIDDVSFRRVNHHFTNPQIVLFDTISAPGYILLGASPGFSSYAWFNNLDSSYYTTDSLLQVVKSLDLDYFYVVATNQDGCRGTSEVEALININNIPRCGNDCYVNIPMMHETFPNHEACNSQASFNFGSGHTFCGQTINGSNCSAYTQTQQLNPPISGGLFYVVNNASSVRNIWNRSDASTPSDALLVGDPWNPAATQTWYIDINLIQDSFYCLSTLVSNVQEFQETGFLPVAGIRVSDDAINNFPWPNSFVTLGPAISLRYSQGWRPLQGSFQATVSGMHRIAIVNNATIISNTNGDGRDLGVDEIRLSRLDYQPPSGSISGNQTICTGSPALLTVTLGGNPGPWNFSYSNGSTNIVITGITSSPYILSVTPTQNSTYTLNYVTVGNCTTQTASNAIVTLLPVANASWSADQTICVGNSASQSIHLTGTGPWDFSYSDGTNTTTITGISVSPYVFTVTPSLTTTYTLNYVVMNGCTTLVNQNSIIAVIPYPTGSISAPQPICLGVNTQLSVNLTGTGPWEISYSDGVSSIVVTGITSSPYLINVTPTLNTTYTLNYVVTSGCTTQVGTNVILNPINVDVTIPTSHTICEGSSTFVTYHLTGNGPWDIAYSDGTSTILVNGITSSPYSFSVTPSQTTVYTLNYVVLGSCTTQVNQSFVVTVVPVPSGSFSANQTICSGSLAQLTFTLNGGGYSYIQYTDGTNTYGLGGNSPILINVSPTTTTTYRVNFINVNMCNTAVNLVAVVTVIAADANISGTQTICAGNAANLSINLGTGSNGPWDISYSDGTNNIVVTGITASPYIFTVTPGQTTSYTLNTVITAGCTTQVNSSAIVSMYSPWAIIATQPLSICPGQSTNLQVNLTGVAPWDITYNDGTNSLQITGITASPYLISVTPGQTTTYTLTSVTTDMCTAYMQLNNSTVVTILPLPTGSISADQTICQGATANISINLGGGTGPWNISYSDGTNNNVVTGISASPYIFTVTPGQTTTYTLNYVVMSGCTTQVNTGSVVTIRPPATGTISADQTICAGFSAELTIQLGSSIGPWDLQYSDGTASTLITGISSQPYIFIVTPSQAPTTYTLNYIVAEGCTTQIGNGSTISWFPPPTATLTGNQTICSGSTAQLSLSLTGTPPWAFTYTDGTATFTVTGITGTNYILEVTPGSTTTYSLVNITTVCSTYTQAAQAVVTIISLPTATFMDSSEICNGDLFYTGLTFTGTGPWSVTYTDGTNNYTLTGITANPYLFTLTPTVNTTYTLTSITDANCTGTVMHSTFVNVLPLPLITISGNQTICHGNTVTFTSNLSGNSGNWQFHYTDGTNLAVVGPVSSSPYIWTVTPSGTTTYTITRIQQYICDNQSVSESAVVTVHPLPGAALSGNQTICGNGQVQLSILLTGTAPWTVQYTDGTNNYTITGISSSPYLLNVSPSLTTQYSLLSVTDLYCTNINLNSVATVSVFPLPVLSFQGNQTICAGSAAQITVGINGTDPWGFSYTDGTTLSVISGLSSSPYILNITTSSTVTYSAVSVFQNCSVTVSGEQAVITVVPIPSATISGNQTVCSGNSTILTVSLPPASGPWSFTYTDGTNTQTVTGITSMPWTVSVTPAANTTFSITQVTNGFGCTNGPFNYVLGHYPQPNYTPHGNVYLCVSSQNPPGNIVLGQNYPAAFSYLWSTGATTKTIQVNGAISTSYSVTITDPNTGCSNTDLIWIMHAYPPTFSLNTSFINCQNGCYALQVTSSDPNANGHSYSWTLTDQNFNPFNATGTTQTICYGATYGQFPYAITATSSLGCTANLSGNLNYISYQNIPQKGVLICPIPNSNNLGAPEFATLASMGYTFSWTGPNGFTSNQANPNITHDPSNNQFAEGVYSVTISHASGCSTNYFIGVRACCQTDPNLILLRNGATIVPSAIPNNSTIVIEGDVTVQGQVTWQGVNAFLRPQARIIIPAPTPAQDHRLWMEQSHLRSDCGDTVWYGIDVTGVLALSGTIKHGLVVRKNSIIEDAYNAVRSQNAGFFMLQDAVLDNNYFHVNIRPFDGLNVAQLFETHPGIWDNAQMLCSRPILTIPAGPGWLHPTNAISGRRTHACIRGTNNSGLSQRGIAVNGSYSGNFSPPIASNYQPSLFDNADYGIDIQAIDLDVRDAQFQNIYCNGGFSNPCPIPYLNFTELPTAVRSNSNGARNHIEKNRFFACTNGVNIMRATQNVIMNNDFPNTPGSETLANLNLNIVVFDGPTSSWGQIENNTIRFGRAGIQVLGNRSSLILIRYNKIYNSRLGVVSWRNPQSGISVVSNVIDTRPLTLPLNNLPWNGIHVDELGFSTALIRRNRISSRTNGIFLTGISGPAGSQNFQVLSNGIVMTTNSLNGPFADNYGIRSIALDRPIISSNSIVGPHLFSQNTISNKLTGIEVDNNPNPKVYCNVISKAKDDFVISGNNFPGEVRRNKFHSGHTAILGKSGAWMGTQMSWTVNSNTWHSSDNEFNCPFTLSVLRAEGSPGFNQAVWVYNPISTQPFNPGNSNCIATSTNAVSSDQTLVPGNCQSGWPCTWPVPNNVAYISDFNPDFCYFSTLPARTSEEEEDDGSLEVFPEYTVSDTWVSQMHSIIDTFIDSLESPVQKYYLEQNLYRYLEHQDSLLQTDTLLGSWFSDSERERFVLLREIESHLAEGIYDSALLSLDSWNPMTEHELAYKLVYEITARLGLDSVNILTAHENEILRDIALQCPDSIGSPVHLARSLLLVLDTFSGMSSCEYESLEFVDPDSLNPDTSGILGGEILIVYPNPGDDLVTLEHLFPDAEGYVFRVVNTLGQEELWIDLEEGDNLYEWDTSALQQGLYYVFLYHEGLLEGYKLLSILH